jgi:hypothetical protein
MNVAPFTRKSNSARVEVFVEVPIWIVGGGRPIVDPHEISAWHAVAELTSLRKSRGLGRVRLAFNPPGAGSVESRPPYTLAVDPAAAVCQRMAVTIRFMELVDGLLSRCAVYCPATAG